jgi:DNA-binding SARP family transcriptional activator
MEPWKPDHLTRRSADEEPTPVAANLLGSVLEGLSDAIVLVDDRGRVVWWNGVVARHIAAAAPHPGRHLTCCALLGCEENTAAADEAGCLTRVALASGDGFAMRRLRPPARSSVLGDWIAARPVRTERGRPLIAFHVRRETATEHSPDEDGDAPQAVLAVAALGDLQAWAGGRRLEGDWLQQRPGQLFRYLLSSRARPASPEDIVAALWPDRGPDSVANVRYCMYKLRDQLDGRDRARPSFIIHSTGGYRLDPKRLRLDVDAFQAEATAGLAARCRGERRPAEVQLTRALERYRGDFLGDDPYAEWAFTERDYLRSLASKALAALSELSLEDGRLGSAEVHLQRLARLEPYDSAIRELLIEVCLRRGRRTEALRHYNSLRLGLLRAFGEQPEFDLADVTARIAGSRPRMARHAAQNGGRRA